MRVIKLFRRRPWCVSAGFFVFFCAAGFGGYSLLYYFHLHEADQADARFDFATAVEHRTACISLWPGQSCLYLRAARSARRGGDLEKASASLDECLRLGGSTPEYLLEYAMLRVQKGDLRDPSRFLVGVLKDDPPESPLILESLARGYYHVYMLGAARHYAEQAVQRDPGNVSMLLLLARIHDSKVRFDEAERCFRDAIAAQPQHAQARLELAQFLLRQKKFDEANQYFEELHHRGYERQAVLMGLALCRKQDGRTEEELALLDELLIESPDHVQALVERGRIRLDASELNAAERDLRHALVEAPYDRFALVQIARCLDQLGRNDESELYKAKLMKYESDMKELQKLIEEIAKPPADPEKNCQAGLICRRYGRDREAERWFLAALQIDPKHKPTYECLADLYAHVGRSDLAAQYRLGPR